MSRLKLTPINTLGAEFKRTKSEKAFKEIYDRLRRGVINYYSNFGKDHQIVEDSYNEAMISFWANIDKLDIVNYSVSTNVYLKTKQSIIRHNLKKERATGSGNDFMQENSEISDNISFSNDDAVNGKYGKYANAINSRVTLSDEDVYIDNESRNVFWALVRKAKFFDIVYDHYYNGLKYKELADKYNIEIQIVKNRVFHGKKQIKQILIKEYEEISQIFD